MGLLDDAIREHLELKRRCGADAEEIALAERDALGPARRGPEPLEVPSGAPQATVEAEREPADEPVAEREGDARSGGAVAASSLPGSEPEPEPEPAGTEPAGAGFDPEPDPEPATRVVAPAPEPAPEARDAQPEPVEPEPRPEPAAYAAPPASETDEPGEDLAWGSGQDEWDEPVREGAGQETVAFDPLAGERDAAAGPSEDVLEETPEFLQETPEHDRLWFEQRPPRDFDFDK